MKKLNVLLIVAMLAAALVAANPAGKLVRLEVINASGDTVYLKLEGKHTGAFYYLTIADSDTTTFTILVDDYKRTTWACNGIKSSGSLVMSGNVRLKFVQCGTFPLRRALLDWNDDGWMNVDTFWLDFDNDGLEDANELFFEGWDVRPNFGEPTQEKVVYWASYGNTVWAKVSHFGWANVDWYSDGSYNDVNWVHLVLWVRLRVGIAWRTAKFPLGIYMRYRY